MQVTHPFLASLTYIVLCSRACSTLPAEKRTHFPPTLTRTRTHATYIHIYIHTHRRTHTPTPTHTSNARAQALEAKAQLETSLAELSQEREKWVAEGYG